VYFENTGLETDDKCFETLKEKLSDVSKYKYMRSLRIWSGGEFQIDNANTYGHDFQDRGNARKTDRKPAVVGAEVGGGGAIL